METAGANATTGADVTGAVWNSAQSSIALGGHLPVLDGLRGLAILLVILFHHTQMQSRTWFDEIVVRAARAGWMGVDLFFVLSGFLITGILLHAKGSSRYFRSFYARRTLRIFPLYYAVVFFSLVVLPRVWPHSDLAQMGARALREHSSLWYWLYGTDFVIARDGGFSHPILSIAWSLAIEEQFYLMWAVVVLLLEERTLRRVSLALVAAALVIRVALIAGGAHDAAPYVLPFARMDTLAIGAFLAIEYRRRGFGSFAPAAPWIAGAAALLLAIIVATNTAEMWEGVAMQTAGYSLTGLLFGSVLVMAVAARPDAVMSGLLTAPWLRWLGKYSYALYLFHVPIRRVVRDSYYGVDQFPVLAGSQLPGQLIFYVVATAPALIAAWISWHVYEKHFLKLKALFPY